MPFLEIILKLIGGSCWGAGMIVNHDGTRQPSQLELDLALAQSKEFAEVMNKLK